MFRLQAKIILIFWKSEKNAETLQPQFKASNKKISLTHKNSKTKNDYCTCKRWREHRKSIEKV